MQKSTAHKKIILFYAILPVLSSRARFALYAVWACKSRNIPVFSPFPGFCQPVFFKTAAIFFHFVRKSTLKTVYFLLFQKNFDFLAFPY